MELLRGRRGWLPPRLQNELQVIKREHKIDKDSIALDKLASFARIGREMDYIYRGQFDKMAIFKKRRK